MAVSSSVLAFAAVVVSKARNQTVRLRRPSVNHDAPIPGAATGPLLSGIYRGRAVEMTLAASGTLNITARVANPDEHAAEFAQGDRMAAVWLPALCRHRLNAWSGDWSVAVRGSRLFFTCHVSDGAPERMGRALDLACDLADAVDRL